MQHQQQPEQSKAPSMGGQGHAAGMAEQQQGADTPAVRSAADAARMVWAESKRLWGIGLPIAVGMLSMYAISSITQMFIGHLGNLPLAAASIGLSVFATFALGFLLGMGSALETLCGQAYGAGQVAMLGVYLQRSWIILTATTLLMSPLFVFAEPLLLLAGQDPDVARESGRFALYILPSVFAMAVNFAGSKFLQAQSKVNVPAWIGLGALLVNVVLNYLLVVVLGWGLPGAAAAYDAAHWVIALGQAAYIIGWCGDGWRGWSSAAFHGIWAFVRLSLESAVMLCLEIWYMSAITVLTGHLGDAQIAVDSLGICMNVNGWEGMIFIGLNAAISVRVSNELGSGRPRAAWNAVVVVVAEALLIGLLCMALILVFRDSFSVIFTGDADLQRAVSRIAGLLGLTMGMDLYFQRHDGQAVTCEDFYAAMCDANNAQLPNFLQWYSQAGTPTVKVTSSYDPSSQTFSLKLSQEVPPTPGQPIKEPMFIPVAVGLVDSTGKDMPLTSVYSDGTLQTLSSDGQPVFTTVLQFKKKEEEFVFQNVPERPVPSLLRGYSAPVRLDSDLSESDLFFLLANDSDEFNRWEAGQVLARKLMLSLVADFQQQKTLVLNPKFVDGLRSILRNTSLDKEFIAKAITLPGQGEIMDMMAVADPDAVHAVRNFIKKELALQLKDDLLAAVTSNRSSEAYTFNHDSMARRALKNTCLAYLASLNEPDVTELALHEYKTATNMTEQFAALAALSQNPGQVRDDALLDFYNKWQDDYLVVSKWFALQATSDIPGNVANVQKLLSHPAFDMRNPNKVYSLIGGFCGSPVNFHAKDGSGYKFLGEVVLQLDKINPQVASRMVSAFSRWRRYDETRQALAKAQLEMIVSANGLSENVYEIASKSLAD